MKHEAKLEELLSRWDELREQGREVAAEELCADSPELETDLKMLIDQLKAMDWLDQGDDGEHDSSGEYESSNGNQRRRQGLTVPPLLAGRYRLEALIAEGGFGEVWRATDTALLRSVAIKVTTLACVDEARLVARLKHPGIVSVHDVGSEGGFCFIVFDLVEGSSLAERIKQRRLSWRESAGIVAAVADYLQYAHEKGFIHRDIKPANILLDQEGKPVLADFGIAVTEGELQHEAMTTLGTLAYMSPEQLTAGKRIDLRTDVYSLVVVLYELLTGRMPFEGETLAELRKQILTGTPPSVGSLNSESPPELERICLKCLAKDAAKRYPSAQDLAHDLQKLLASE